MSVYSRTISIKQAGVGGELVYASVRDPSSKTQLKENKMAEDWAWRWSNAPIVRRQENVIAIKSAIVNNCVAFEIIDGLMISYRSTNTMETSTASNQ